MTDNPVSPNVLCDGCRWCGSHGCNEHEQFAVWHPPADNPVSPSEGLRAAMKAADEKLACMWSNDEAHRTNLGHTCAVQASEILRAALADSAPVEPRHSGDDLTIVAKRANRSRASVPREPKWTKTTGSTEAAIASAPVGPTTTNLPPGPYRIEWPDEQGGLFKIWGTGWAVPLVAMGVQSCMEAIVELLNAGDSAPVVGPDAELLAELDALLRDAASMAYNAQWFAFHGDCEKMRTRLAAALRARPDDRDISLNLAVAIGRVGNPARFPTVGEYADAIIAALRARHE